MFPPRTITNNTSQQFRQFPRGHIRLIARSDGVLHLVSVDFNALADGVFYGLFYTY